MRPLICPQCGGQIDEYSPGATFTVCEYCGTRFLIEANKAPSVPVEPPDLEVADPTAPFVKILAAVIAAIAIVGFIAIVSVKNKKPDSPSYFPTLRGTPVPSVAPTATPDTALLRFGGTGAENGQFDDATSIAVDGQGMIYVADGLRVHQFDANGKFQKSLQVPAKGRNYERAHNIYKIAVTSDERLVVCVGGVILVYSPTLSGPPRTIQVAPDFIQDFVVKADGSMLAVSDNDRVETLLFINKNGAVTRHIEGFHTDALNAKVSPLDTGIELVRIAVDAKGNIFSVYALGAAGNYTLSYNDKDLAIARFTPDAKFVRSFPGSTDIAGLAVDKWNRLEVAVGSTVVAYDSDGNNLGSRSTEDIGSFALDADGNIYTITNNTVAKFPPIP